MICYLANLRNFEHSDLLSTRPPEEDAFLFPFLPGIKPVTAETLSELYYGLHPHNAAVTLARPDVQTAHRQLALSMQFAHPLILTFDAPPAFWFFAGVARQSGARLIYLADPMQPLPIAAALESTIATSRDQLKIAIAHYCAENQPNTDGEQE